MLAKSIGDIVYAKVVNECNLLIVCKDEDQLQKAVTVKEIAKLKMVSSGKVGANRDRGNKGVIGKVPMCLKMEDINNNVKGGKIRNARRMTIKNGEKRETETVLIEFEGEVLPQRIFIGYMSYPVKEYVQKPIRCFNCQRFGHIAKVCRGKTMCKVWR